MENAGRPPRRFQYSLRTLFAITAIVALLLVPVAWVARERQQILVAREAALRAVVLAERNRALAELARTLEAERAHALEAKATRQAATRAETGSPLPFPAESVGQNVGHQSGSIAGEAERTTNNRPEGVDQLLRENAELRKTVDQLRREIERLKTMKGR